MGFIFSTFFFSVV